MWGAFVVVAVAAVFVILFEDASRWLVGVLVGSR